MKRLLLILSLAFIFLMTPTKVSAECGVLSEGSSFGEVGTICLSSDVISPYQSCSGGSTLGSTCCSNAAECSSSTTADAASSEGVRINLGGLDLSSLNPSPNFSSQGLVGQILGGSENTPGFLALAIIFGGIALLFMIVQAGFAILFRPEDPKSMVGARTRITYALIGFGTLFTAYWIVQILQTIFRFNITGV